MNNNKLARLAKLSQGE